MQSGRADRIERSVAILSSNRVYPPAGLRVVLAMLTPLRIHTKLISTLLRLTSVKYIPHNVILALLVILFLACIRHLKRNIRLQTVSVSTTVLTPNVIPVTGCRRIPDFPSCRLKPNIRPCSQSDCSVRAPPISIPTYSQSRSLLRFIPMYRDRSG